MSIESNHTRYDFVPDFKEKITERRLDMLLKQTTMTGVFSVLFAAILTVTMHDTVHFVSMCIWLTINAAMVISREVAVYPKLRLKRAQGKVHARLVFSTITAFWVFAGCLWGWGAYFYLPSSDQIELMVAFIAVIVGITSGNIISFAPAVWIGMLFVSLTLSGFLLKLYQYNFIILFYCTLFYLLYLFITMLRVSKVVIHTISLDLKNQQLLQLFTVQKKRAEVEKIKAEKANQSKTEFLTSASHDLRQPLNSIGLFLFALKQKIQLGASDTLLLVEKIEQAHSALTHMFSRILEVSSVETGKITPQPQLIETQSVISTIVEEYRQQAQSKQLVLNYTPSDITLYTDDFLLSRIIRNLVDNAIKYTPKGAITISETLGERSYQLNIQDTGIGIPEHELSRIFEEYHQVANKKRDAKQGLGLGLFITFRLCQLLGFSINVQSSEGEGACFTLTCDIHTLETPYDLRQTEHDLTPFINLKLLVVDDDITILSGMKLILEQWQCQVNTAENITDAMALAHNTMPGVILCDYRLEDEFTGIDLLTRLEAKFGKQFATIFITGENIASDDVNSSLANYHVLQKPVNPIALHDAIKRLTENSAHV